MNRKSVVAATLAAAFVLGAVSDGAMAQSDLFGKAKKMLGGETSASPGAAGADLGTAEISDGLREALRVGTERVVGQLGQADGFNGDPTIHIPLPPTLQKVQSTLRAVGMSELADDVELKLNRAAEAATPKAKALFADAISEMTLEDARGILRRTR